MSYLLVLGGLLLLAGGGEALIRGAVALAERLGISPVFVGLTVVAIGTSTPELTVAINAAMTGTPDIAVGSVIGSNISNILLVLAATALVQPIIVDPRMVFRDGLFLLAVSFGVAMVALTGLITPGRARRWWCCSSSISCSATGRRWCAMRRPPSGARRKLPNTRASRPNSSMPSPPS
jgi:cation:H+ antiporter